jgi:DNA-binding Lrp family transcriptional regulator
MDETDFEILKIIDANCRISISKIAHKLNFSLRNISQRLDRLIEENVIKRFSIQFNYKLLGFRNYAGIIDSQNKLLPDSFYEKLQNVPEIHQIWHLLKGNAKIYFFVKNKNHLERFIDKISDMGHNLIDVCEIDIFDSASQHGSYSLTDWRIISYLLNDSRATKKQISITLGISEKTVNRRLNRMLEKNLIQFIPEINFEAISGMVTALLSLETNGNTDYIHHKIKSDNTIKYWRTEDGMNTSLAYFLYGNNLNEIYEMFNEVIKRDYIDNAKLHFIVRNWETNMMIEEAISEKIHKSFGLIN